MINFTKDPLSRATTSVEAIQHALLTAGFTFTPDYAVARLATLLHALSHKSVMYAQATGNCLCIHLRSDYLANTHHKTLDQLLNQLACSNMPFLLYVQKSVKVTQPPNEVYLYLRKTHEPVYLSQDVHQSSQYRTVGGVDMSIWSTHDSQRFSNVACAVYPPTKFESLPLYTQLGDFDKQTTHASYAVYSTRGGPTKVTTFDRPSEI